jgi:5'-methylthioadenosine phosphorylase
VGHVSLADPVCPDLCGALTEAGRQVGARIRNGGTYLCIEGPQFSTRAESNLYRSWKVDVISMTAMQEARLAREAELCYAILVLVTDYDCWHESVQAVDVSEILRVMRANVESAQKAVINLARRVAKRERTCACGSSLKDSIITDRAAIPKERIEALRPIIGKYV